MMALKTENLFVGYGKKVVVSEVTIGGEKGEIICLLGPNGAGKTTILRTIAGLLEPIQGEVYIKEKKLSEIYKKELAKQLAVVLTNKFTGGLMTVFEVASMGRYPHTGMFGRLTKKDVEKTLEALKTVDGEALAQRYFEELSDGEKQKILVARALVQEPEIIVLDEPTTHLDIRHRLELLDILRKLSKEKGITVILSLHEVDMALKSCDKVVLVKDHKVLAYGTPEDVVNESILKELYNIKNGNFNNLLGSIEISNLRKSSVFVLGGSGFGAPIYRALTKQDIGVSTGVLHENDVDYEIARTMGIEIESQKALEELSSLSLARAKDKINQVPVVVDSGYPIGKMNIRNTELLLYALERGKKVLTLRSKEENRALYGTESEKMIFCATISLAIKNL